MGLKSNRILLVLTICKFVNTAARFSLAAGRIEISYGTQLSHLPDARSASMSGFWVTEQFFLTAAHYVDVMNLKTDQERTVFNSYLEQKDLNLAQVDQKLHIGEQNGRFYKQTNV